MLITVNILMDYKKCEGSKCGACAFICPTNVFTLEDSSVSIKSPEYCKLCGNCLEICPNRAITILEINGNLY
jgi:NAD-dependent dihydropyrimidine dehydrogenase PreA subunit